MARDASLADPMQRWKEARRARFASGAVLYVALVAGFALLLARAAGGSQPLWVGAALGAAWIPVALELTGYYWSVLLVLAFLGARDPPIGPALCALRGGGLRRLGALALDRPDPRGDLGARRGRFAFFACLAPSTARAPRVTPV